MKSLSPEEAIAILSDMKIDIPVPQAAVTQRKRNVALDMAISALSCSEIPNSSDSISRWTALDALWKALYEYEDMTEKQFQESEDLDVGDWIGHRIFVQNMNDIDRQTILNLPSAQPGWIPWNSGKFPEESGTYTVTAYDGATKRVTYAKYQKRLKRWELSGARAYWRVLAWMPSPKPWEGDKNE